MRRALTCHWPEYLIEAAGLGIFMVAACLATALLELPASPVLQAIADPGLRRALVGSAMGLTAIALTYSPWGKQSGAHFNPTLTLTFFRLGKVAPWDALFYVLAQYAGGLAGVLVAVAVLGQGIMDPAVGYIVTVPGAPGVGVAFLAEAAISFGLMVVVCEDGIPQRRVGEPAQHGNLQHGHQLAALDAQHGAAQDLSAS
jgi:aquaporin Z